MKDVFDEKESHEIEAQTVGWLYNYFKNLSENKKNEDKSDEVQDERR